MRQDETLEIRSYEERFDIVLWQSRIAGFSQFDMIFEILLCLFSDFSFILN